MRDSVAELRQALRDHLLQGRAEATLKIDQAVDPSVRWSPHLYDSEQNIAWHVLTTPPESDFWSKRMLDARATRPDLKLGLCAPIHVMNEALLDLTDEMDVEIATFDPDASDTKITVRPATADLIYEERLQLSHATAGRILDRWLIRCHDATTNKRKGVTLEVLTAVLLSQIPGFEVRNRGVSNRSQQVDVRVHNRRATGILSGSDIVLAEAKNWDNAVGTPEYAWFLRKVETRFGRCRLGFFVTTDRFTKGVLDVERVRDSRGDILVVPLDKVTLPALWRTGKSIVDNLEDLVLDAANI